MLTQGENSCVTTEDQNVNVNGKEFMFDSVFGASECGLWNGGCSCRENSRAVHAL